MGVEEVILHPLPPVLTEKVSLSQPGPSAQQQSSVMVQIPQGILRNLGRRRSSLRFWPGNISNPERRRNGGSLQVTAVGCDAKAQSAKMIFVCVEGGDDEVRSLVADEGGFGVL